MTDENGQGGAAEENQAQSVASLLAELQTERLRLAAEAKQRRRAEQRYRAMIEAAPTAMVMIDGEGTIVLTNREADRLFGYPREELLGQPIEILVPERFRPDHPRLRSEFFVHPKAGRIGTGRDLFGLRKNGSEFPVEIGLNPVQTDEGMFIMSVIVDITERKLQDQFLAAANASLDRMVEERTAQLRATEERFELAVRGSTDGLWDWNVLTNDIYFSPRLFELMGYAVDEIPAAFATFEEHLHPDDHARTMRAIDDHLHHNQPYDIEYRLWTKSGEYRWYRARGQAIRNDAGMAYRMAGSISDVTESHRLRERFRLAVEASPAALLMVHADGRIVTANSCSESMFGYDEDELIGKPVEWLVPLPLRDGHVVQREQFFRNPSVRNMAAQLDLKGVRKDGTEFPVRVGLSPVDTEDGPAVICGVIDITSEKQALAAMRQAKEAAESASRAKSSFLANMSHEIRTPMNGIIGMAQLLARTELKSHQRDYLSTVEESAHILLRLLNDILDFSKIEAGKLELECADFRLSECVARASQILVLRAAEKGLEIACRVAPEIPDHLRGDAGRLQQVLVNLLGNAVKFTDTGEVFVNVDTDVMAHDRVRLHFSVCDSGIGISREKLEQIFRPFEQAETSTTRRFGGTGLGLTISRQLVEMMRGRMWVDSEPGRGSTFHFTVELEIAPNQHGPELAELDTLRDLPVLVIDDNFTNRRILCEMLLYWHMRPVLAESAAAARQMLETAVESHRPFQLILLDHHMPGEDGFHFAESLRCASTSEQYPIIMISSGASPVDTDLCQKVGIRRFMTKPVIASELLNEILRQLGRRSPAATELTSISATALVPSRRVLLVEDNEINRRVALGLLRARGHHVDVAENGQEAVDILANREFDAVLMDIQMPVMDGYEATTAIRGREHRTGGHVPIIAMTAEALKGDRERCLEIGMDDYVSKPIERAELYRAVERFPAVAQVMAPSTSPPSTSPVPVAATHQDPTAGPPPPSATAAPATVITQATNEHAAVDWSVAAERLGGGADVIREFADLFRKESPQLLANLRSAIEARDANLLRRAAHTFKGSATYFGADRLIEIAQCLENSGREKSVAGLADNLARFESELNRVLSALEAGPPAS